MDKRPRLSGPIGQTKNAVTGDQEHIGAVSISTSPKVPYAYSPFETKAEEMVR